MTAALNEMLTRLAGGSAPAGSRRTRPNTETLQERIAAGIARARAQGTSSGKPIGRAKVAPAREAAIRAALASGKGILEVARELGTASSVVQRIKAAAASG